MNKKTIFKLSDAWDPLNVRRVKYWKDELLERPLLYHSVLPKMEFELDENQAKELKEAAIDGLMKKIKKDFFEGEYLNTWMKIPDTFLNDRDFLNEFKGYLRSMSRSSLRMLADEIRYKMEPGEDIKPKVDSLLSMLNEVSFQV